MMYVLRWQIVCACKLGRMQNGLFEDGLQELSAKMLLQQGAYEVAGVIEVR